VEQTGVRVQAEGSNREENKRLYPISEKARKVLPVIEGLPGMKNQT
jgi:hypothetical protein